MTLPTSARRALLVVGGLIGLVACGREPGVRPSEPGAVQLRLVFPAGRALQPATDSLFTSVWLGPTRLAGPVESTPDSQGRFRAELSTPAGPDRQVSVEFLTSPGPNDPEGSTRGVRYLALSELFEVTPGGTASVTATFQPFVTELLAVELIAGRDVGIRFRSVPAAERYRLQVWRTDSRLRTLIVGDTTVTDTLLTWAIAGPAGIVQSNRLVVRPETVQSAGAWSPAVPVPTSVGADLRGRVLVEGEPAPDVLVQLLNCLDGEDTGRETFTDANGRYLFSGIPFGDYRVRLFRGGCGEVFDPPLDAGCLTVGVGGNTRPDVVLTCTGASQWALCTLTWGEFPRDLDMHLYTPPIPEPGSPGDHVYFGNTGSATEAPFAELDADDTSGFGPENISIYRNFPGDYILAVHNFCCGEDTLSRSDARVRIVTPAGPARTIAISGDPNDPREWWIVARISGTSGVVTVIDTLAEFSPIGGLLAPGVDPARDVDLKKREERR